MVEFWKECRRWSPSVAWWNLRWRVGYWIGGFTSATRAKR